MEIKLDRRPLHERLRTIPFEEVVDRVTACCFEAACRLPLDVIDAIKAATLKETNPLGKSFLEQYLENAKLAAETPMPICQDTGFAVYFVEMGEMLRIEGGSIYEAITEGTARGYKEGFLRKSIVSEPLFHRKNTGDNTPPIIHLTLVPGDKLNVILAPKGVGSENMSALKMLKPSDGRAGVVDFVVNSVINAGGNPCPPTVVGVGMGGTFEKAAFLSKKALLRHIGEPNPDPEYADLEAEILEKINASGVGPQGLGGNTTSLAVHIEYFPCHIASLPVAVNLNCHAARHAGFEL
ncbi:MAG: fumarate hydratase [Lentisphaeria bacterium]|nr:fumarate hydratase [Lentisphaeria bacterium]